MNCILLFNTEHIDRSIVISKERQNNDLIIYKTKEDFDVSNFHLVKIGDNDKYKIVINYLLNDYQIHNNIVYFDNNPLYCSSLVKDYLKNMFDDEEEVPENKMFLDLKKLQIPDLPFFVLLNYIDELFPNVEMFDDFVLCDKEELESILSSIEKSINTSMPLCTRVCMNQEKNLDGRIPNCRTIYSDIKINLPIDRIYSVVEKLSNCKIWFNETYFTIILKDSDPKAKEDMKNSIMNSKKIPIKVVPNNFRILCPFTQKILNAEDTGYKTIKTETIEYYLVPEN